MSASKNDQKTAGATTYGTADAPDSATGSRSAQVAVSVNDPEKASEETPLKVHAHDTVKRDWDILKPGEKWESRKFYPEVPWTTIFDFKLVVFMSVSWVILMACSYWVLPGLILHPTQYLSFWQFQFIKLCFMLFVAFLGGLVVLTYHVKVNYTRKIQHFCAYLIPLLMENQGTTADPIMSQDSVILLMSWWGYWFTLMSFTVFVYPIRTRIRIIDVMFASLDRPEDRPNTLYWITTQIFMGYIVLSLFRWYCDYTDQVMLKNLVFIPVIVTGIGDGLAEPVGIRFGKHKYYTRGFWKDRDKIYTRSYEGSACVFISGILSCLALYNQFANWIQVLLATILIPIIMTLAEAFSPHTWDTPFLMGSGCLVLWAITFA